jgi:Asp/Glu/hydantoin racemase
MKLAIILPGDYSRELCERREEYLYNFASADTEIKVFTTGGTKSVTSNVDFALVSPGAMKRAIEVDKNGFDGIVLHGM